MAIDVKSLTQIISDFRKLQSKDSISPESIHSFPRQAELWYYQVA